MSAKVVRLDRLLAHYGPETRETRDLLRVTVANNLDRIWPQERTQASDLAPPAAAGDAVLENIEALSPRDDRQRSLQAQAVNIAIALAETRSLMYEQATDFLVSEPMLIVLVFWLTMVFFSFGLFAPRNAIVIASFLVSAWSVPARFS